MARPNGRLYQLDHSTYVCQYHLVWASKYRGAVLSSNYIKAELKRIFKSIARWKGFRIVSWHVGDDHVHLYVIIPPKYSVSYALQVFKGKSSSWIKKRTKQFPRGSLWCRGYFVSTLGINEHQVRNYINNQKHHQADLPKLPF